MKTGFTGTRMGLSESQRLVMPALLHQLAVTELHHGDCVGADAQVDYIAQRLGIRRVAHPPTAAGLRAHCEAEEVMDPLPFLARNRVIVLSTELLIACPDGPERTRSGTWATVRLARRLKLPWVIVMPDGERSSNVLAA